MLLLLGKKPFLQISALFQQHFFAFPLQHMFLQPCSAAGQGPDPVESFCSLWVTSSLQSACCRAVWFAADPSMARAGWDVTAVPPVPSRCHRSLRPREKQKATACLALFPCLQRATAAVALWRQGNKASQWHRRG